MANELDYNKLVKLAGQGMGHSEAAREMGLAVSQISSLTFSQALVDAGQVDSAPATARSVVNLRHNERNRWELIAARIGESVSRAKELYEEAGYDRADPLPPSNGDDEEATPRRGGRKTGSARKTGTASKSASKKSGVKVVASKSKSKAKTAGSKAKASSARPRGRARTLAERRAARGSNPS